MTVRGSEGEGGVLGNYFGGKAGDGGKEATTDSKLEGRNSRRAKASMGIEYKSSVSNVTDRGCVDSSKPCDGCLEIREGEGGGEGSQDGVSWEVNTRGDWVRGGAAQGGSWSIESGTSVAGQKGLRG